jgi:hypothetical protein
MACLSPESPRPCSRVFRLPVGPPHCAYHAPSLAHLARPLRSSPSRTPLPLRTRLLQCPRRSSPISLRLQSFFFRCCFDRRFRRHPGILSRLKRSIVLPSSCFQPKSNPQQLRQLLFVRIRVNAKKSVPPGHESGSPEKALHAASPHVHSCRNPPPGARHRVPHTGTPPVSSAIMLVSTGKIGDATRVAPLTGAATPLTLPAPCLSTGSKVLVHGFSSM